MPETKRTSTKAESFTPEEKAAMKERARELKAQKGKADGEADLLAKIAAMTPDDRSMAETIHAVGRPRSCGPDPSGTRTRAISCGPAKP